MSNPKAFEKLKNKIFEYRTPEQYGLTSYRENSSESLCGIELLIESGTTQYLINITHDTGTTFNYSCHVTNGQLTNYVRHSFQVEFDQIPTKLIWCLNQYRA